MNEITRVHLAKVAYDIEVAAKKQLEKYMKSLEAYTGDSEVLHDIEIRITELLAERGVKAGGVISTADVAAIREQLGEPYEFAEEDGDIAVGAVEEREERKFFRSTDDAVLGGVLSGIAAYFKVNPLWTRLIFILLTFISFGFSVLVYILLWIAVPPARSATDKLRQSGRPVTLDSIRELNESQETTKPNRVAPVVLRIITITLGIFSLLSAITVLSTLITGIFGVDLNQAAKELGFYGQDNNLTLAAWVVYGLVLFGMAMLVGLFSLATYALFAQKINKRIIISGVVIIALGMAAFVATVGIGATQSWRIASEAQSQVKTTKVELPAEFANVRSVEIENISSKSEVGVYLSFPSIEYVVDTGAPRYELSALPGAKPSVKIEGDKAKISLTIPNDYRNTFVQTQLTIYGPALTEVTNHSGSLGYTAATQDTLAIIAKGGSYLTVNSGAITNAKVSGAGTVDLGSTSITSLTVDAEQGMSVSAGTIRDLVVTQPNVCPINGTATSTVQVVEVTSNMMTYNGESRNASTYRTSCSEVVIGNDEVTMY